jgi:hypothetical protein
MNSINSAPCTEEEFCPGLVPLDFFRRRCKKVRIVSRSVGGALAACPERASLEEPTQTLRRSNWSGQIQKDRRYLSM